MPKKRILIFDPDPEPLLRMIESASQAAEYLVAHDRERAIELAPRADALFAFSPHIDQWLVDAMPRLRWIQVLNSGIDALTNVAMPTQPVLTTVAGIHGPQMAELAILMMLALRRRLSEMLDDQRRGRWRRWRQPLLAGSKIVIVGTGAIARETARCFKLLGTTVVGVTRTVRTIPFFDDVIAYDQLSAGLPGADALILLCPLTEETRNLVDASLLAALPRHAILLNLARGGLLDEQAAQRALARGALGGIGLDTYAEEPPPADFPLRQMADVIMTPHIGGFSATYEAQMAPILFHNIKCYLSDSISDMINVVR